MADDPLGTAGDELVDPAPPESPETPPGATDKVESFFDPSSLPPELKAQWSNMHRAYTKKLEKFRGAGEKAELVDKFWQDPDFAKSTIQQWAQQHGVSLSFGQSQQPSVQPSRGGASPPQELIEAIQEELPTELQWLAKPLAASQWKAQGKILGPILQENRQKEASARRGEYEDLAADLSEKAPGWEAHEDDMNELLGFLQGPALRHRRFGSKLELLHKFITGDATANVTAVRRIGEAARNRSTTGVPGRSTTPNIAERVAAAPNNREAWKIAAQHAVEEVRRSGAQI